MSFYYFRWSDVQETYCLASVGMAKVPFTCSFYPTFILKRKHELCNGVLD
jgi:hypothetical protein